MSLRWPVVVESWLYADPCSIGDALVARLGREAARAATPHVPMPMGTIDEQMHAPRDRYYTMARRCHVKQLMRGRR